MQSDIDPRSLIGRRAFDRDGHRIGTVDEVYLDDVTGVPGWAAVRTGLFGRDAFVPLRPSEFVEGDLRVPYEKALVKQAPGLGVGRRLSPEQELLLYRHYGLALPSAPSSGKGADAPAGGG
ncbi:MULTISPECIES: PRC-barrel domain-containing protein [Streptomyces]|uniref:PRC-barrel domain-containing protein n=1 Tax=Streptomyces sudanensis TaxID=436397 RepID=A0ABY4TH74_9ACTN|nr:MULTISPECIES: PRC-barrel domain-containing protein [Streptomyces]MCP9959783.1 PRC-barrel domain-containing protein [Streptomyces sudanensis]MCP9988822.1 PRC-barrel domain-containing protein [Streptomyces sudanensis]MCP9999808.1 PRC-barrel domain-containing protein [Streptomyces sudanensis]URN18112.1 PRC-barrel domain-containing protein [Streptomyces sudanensis]